MMANDGGLDGKGAWSGSRFGASLACVVGALSSVLALLGTTMPTSLWRLDQSLYEHWCEAFAGHVVSTHQARELPARAWLQMVVEGFLLYPGGGGGGGGDGSRWWGQETGAWSTGDNAFWFPEANASAATRAYVEGLPLERQGYLFNYGLEWAFELPPLDGVSTLAIARSRRRAFGRAPSLQRACTAEKRGIHRLLQKTLREMIARPQADREPRGEERKERTKEGGRDRERPPRRRSSAGPTPRRGGSGAGRRRSTTSTSSRTPTRPARARRPTATATSSRGGRPARAAAAKEAPRARSGTSRCP